MFQCIRDAGSLLVHHPYHSFSSSVERFKVSSDGKQLVGIFLDCSEGCEIAYIDGIRDDLPCAAQIIIGEQPNRATIAPTIEGGMTCYRRDT